MKNKNYLSYALAALKHAYAPYSHYKVGAVVFLHNGKCIRGVNVENASYGLTNCAERSALFTCYSLGYKKEDIKGFFNANNKVKVLADIKGLLNRKEYEEEFSYWRL